MTPVATQVGGDIIAPAALGDQTGTAPASPVESEIIAPASPAELRARAIEAIVRENGCTEAEAESTLRWINGYVVASRCRRYRTMYPSDSKLRSKEYRIFDSIIPHGATSAPGSAHQAIENALLDRTRDEVTIMHDQRDELDSPRYCTVQVCLAVIR